MQIDIKAILCLHEVILTIIHFVNKTHLTINQRIYTQPANDSAFWSLELQENLYVFEWTVN